MGKNKSPHNNAKLKNKRDSSIRRGLSIGLLAFGLAVITGGPIGAILEQVSITMGFLILFCVLALSIAADVIGVAVTAAKDVPFNAMAADKVPGSKEALFFVKNASKVNSFCADVIGDIAGTISGVIAAPIILLISSNHPNISNTVISMGLIGLIAFINIGGKAFEKEFAVRNSTAVILFVGKAIYWFKKLIPGLSPLD